MALMRLIAHYPRSGPGLEVKQETRVVLRASDYGWLGLTGAGRGTDYGYAGCARLVSAMCGAFGIGHALMHVGPPCYRHSAPHPLPSGWRALEGTPTIGFGLLVPVGELMQFDGFCRRAFTYEPVTVIVPRTLEQHPATLRVP